MYSTKFDVVKPNNQEGERIIQLLVCAFENGSGISQICQAEGEGEELRRRLYLVFQMAIAMQAAAKQPILTVMKDAQIVGVAIFAEPESIFPLSLKVYSFIQISFGASPAVAWRIWKNNIILKKYHPPEPHYYLTLLGVHPNFQKRGIARALLDELHSRSDAHPLSTGIYLETANSRNVSLYQHFGYHLMTQLDINGLETFLMFRPNRNH